MGNLRDWLQLFRSHTSPLEMTITITGSALAVGTIWDIKVLLFLIFGWLYHNAGYGHNSAEDYIQGYDQDDPNKAHHPLQRGAIDPRTARYVCIVLVFLTFLYGIFISEFNWTAMVLLAVITFMGAVYNVAGKRMKGKFIPIAIAHSLLLPFAFFGSGGEIENIVDYPYFKEAAGLALILGTVYLIVQIIYQIMIEGDLKDIDMEEASFLRTIGASVKDGVFTSSILARGFSYLTKSLSIAVLFWLIHAGKGGFIPYAVLSFFAVFMLVLDDKLMGDRKWDHSETLRSMAVMEVLSTFALVIAAAPLIGGTFEALIVMAFNIGYFMILNRYLWGTFLRPRV
ncbi:MAG: UbiA family prenyltransferase [Thermoplasmatota archaeon]